MFTSLVDSGRSSKSFPRVTNVTVLSYFRMCSDEHQFFSFYTFLVLTTFFFASKFYFKPKYQLIRNHVKVRKYKLPLAELNIAPKHFVILSILTLPFLLVFYIRLPHITKVQSFVVSSRIHCELWLLESSVSFWNCRD